MFILVDYDNLPPIETRRGVLSIVTKILNTIGASRLTAHPRVRFKLYGGWYELSRMTRRAQLLSEEVRRVFPRAVPVTATTGAVSPIVAVELAQGIEIDPRAVIENTFRTRELPSGLRCDLPPFTNCVSPGACPLAHFAQFISASCPERGCRVEPKQIMGRDEQKLVDGMLTADLIYSAVRRQADVGIVSSDDDLWPGIKSALLLGANVIHIHTIPGRITPSRYSRGAGRTYSQLALN